jgi:hypothetical protein
VDFFLKTETEDKLIDRYEKFKELKPQLGAIKTLTDYENFKKKKDECKEVRAFLNLLELIAVGVNQKAFSDIVSYDYWGDVLLSGWEASRGFIGFYRKDATDDGTSETYKELEILYKIWKARADKARKKDRAVAAAQST